MEAILLNFDGYWLEQYKDEMPHTAGIYCVYASEPIGTDKIVVLRELIYIGSSDDIAASLADHAQTDEWKMRLRDGEKLCYSFASAASEDVDLVREVLISHHTPPCNRIAYERTPCAELTVSIAGEHIFLDDSIVVGTS